MAAKKKRGGKPRAKARTKVKAKAKAKAKGGAKKAKRAPARKRAPVKAAKPRSPKIAEPSTERSFSLIIDEVIEEPLVDVSTILRVKDGVARSRRDIDEDELKQFSDPSLVIEAQKPRREDEDTDESLTHLPDLFAAEARAQKARVADSDGAAKKRHDGSLFGSLGADTPDEEPDED